MQSILSDFYAKDDGGHPNITALVAAGRPWCGVVLKATEGTYYSSGDWLKTVWAQARTAAADRYGVDWFRGAYHYFRVDEDPIAQATKFLAAVDAVGGWSTGDLWPIVDVETAEQPPIVPAEQIVSNLTKYAEKIRTAHGRAPMLYAGSYFRDHGIKDHCGCQYLWTAAYGSTLPATLYTNMGWPLELLFGWQYEGTDGYSGPKSYPRDSPAGSGPQDLTAVTICNGATPDEQLAWIRAHIGT
jgi:GH25 family lysozyme M1 (1,4-beta-N-acetylmuramidase)